MKTKQPTHNTDMSVPDDVVDLFVRFESQESTPDDLRLLMSWAANNPDKLDDFEALNDIWTETGKVLPDQDVIHGPEVSHFSGKAKMISIVFGNIAAIAAVVVLVFGLTFYQSPTPLDYQTQVGEIKQVALEDGSRVHLNGASAVTVNYVDNKRLLKMDKGEAYFEVAHDKDRAFIVEVGGVLVRALGTAFNIDYTHDNVTVSVIEGTVQVGLSEDVRRGKKPEETEILASIGDKVEFKTIASLDRFSYKNAPVIPVLQKNSKPGKYPLAWQKGILNLDGETLGVAVERINRQSVKQVVISDIRLNDLPIYGSFYLNNVDSFINAIEVLYPIKHVETVKGYLLSSSEE